MGQLFLEFLIGRKISFFENLNNLNILILMVKYSFVKHASNFLKPVEEIFIAELNDYLVGSYHLYYINKEAAVFRNNNNFYSSFYCRINAMILEFLAITKCYCWSDLHYLRCHDTGIVFEMPHYLENKFKIENNLINLNYLEEKLNFILDFHVEKSKSFIRSRNLANDLKRNNNDFTKEEKKSKSYIKIYVISFLNCVMQNIIFI